MSEQQQGSDAEPAGRPVGGTEHSWCKAVPGGTGMTVLALLLSKPPDLRILQNALQELQILHPILRSRLHFNDVTNNFSYTTPPTSILRIQPFDSSSTAQILNNTSISPLHSILEHELNRNDWRDLDVAGADLLFASAYTMASGQWVLALRLHTSACDRTTAAALLRELLELMGGDEIENEKELEREFKGEIGLGIEEYVPSGKANKPFWARGMDVLGYSLNSFRLANLDFVDADSPRCSRVVRLQIDPDKTNRILSGCRSRGIGLCGALAAAGIIAARSSKSLPDGHWEKYAVVTLLDCRSILNPALSNNHLGFYHSAIMNTHDIRGGEGLWELANRTYTAFANAKKNNKHFSDMADINFLMCKAIDNPGLTPSSSLRTSFISVFEDPVIDRANDMYQRIGLEDYLGCASVHGVGPSIAIFDTIRDGCLDCACVYPSPLHSREQMQELIQDMERILVNACKENEQIN
ncbi:hypothetical protein NMG60_11001488 [Bertholletia excelsa]